MRLKLLIVVNPAANNGEAQKVWSNVHQQLNQRHVDYDYRISKYKGHIQLITEQLIKNNWTAQDMQLVMVVLGGDGSLNEVITSIGNFVSSPHPLIPIALIPAGHNNNFAITNGIKSDWQGALKQILTCQKQRQISIGHYVDQGISKNHYFLNNLEIGLGSDLLNELKSRRSRFKLIRWFKNFLSFIITLYNLEMFSLRLNLNGHYLQFSRTIEILIQNNPRLNEKLMLLKKEPIPHDQFRIMIVEKRTFISMLLILLGLILGKKPKSKLVHYYYANQITLNDSTLRYGNVDGSVIGSKFFDINCDIIDYPFWI